MVEFWKAKEWFVPNRLVRWVLLILLINPLMALCQKQGNVWYFGDGFGLDFNATPPTLLDDGQTVPLVACGDNHIEGTASIADSSGGLLFYTDGQTIWNKNHQPMPNGLGLLGGSSSTQAVLIVPEPESDTRYYIFTTDDFCNDLENGLRYSIVDICEDNKQGDVLEGFKNELLLDTVSEKLAAIRHANGVDYWILTHRYFSNEFHAFQLTPQGLEPAVVSAVGSVHEGGGSNNMWRAMGQVKASPQGDRVAIGSANCGDIFELFDFNSSTGVVSNALSLFSVCGAYGLEFSPDGTKLFYTPSLTQLDLNAGSGSAADINASAYQYNDPQLECGNALQLGVDGKIYMYNCFDNDISVIHSPNLLGMASNAEPNVYTMPTSALVYGLPAMIAGFDYTASGICETGVGVEAAKEEVAVKAYPNPTTSLLNINLSTNQKATAMGMLDMLGREVLRQPFATQLDVSHLPAGNYVLAIYTADGVLREKVVVE